MKKSAFATMIATALISGMVFSGAASATLVSCIGGTDATAYDLTGKVTPSTNCGIDDPFDGSDGNSNDQPQPGYVNSNSYFGITTWLFDGKYEQPEGSTTFVDGSLLLDFEGDAGPGTFTAGALTGVTDLMLVFKDGNGTSLVAYLMNVSNLRNDSGTYESPFTSPPFTFTGSSPKDVSHISVYYRDGSTPPDEDVPVPEPASLALVGLGLAGIWAARRRRAV